MGRPTGSHRFSPGFKSAIRRVSKPRRCTKWVRITRKSRFSKVLFSKKFLRKWKPKSSKISKSRTSSASFIYESRSENSQSVRQNVRFVSFVICGTRWVHRQILIIIGTCTNGIQWLEIANWQMRAAGAIFFTHSCIFVFLLYHITKVRAFGAPLRNHPGRCAITRPFSKLFENLRKTIRKNKKSSKNAHKKNFEFRRKCFEKKGISW
mgnify:CR=1 FL=1